MSNDKAKFIPSIRRQCRDWRKRIVTITEDTTHAYWLEVWANLTAGYCVTHEVFNSKQKALNWYYANYKYLPLKCYSEVTYR